VPATEIEIKLSEYIEEAIALRFDFIVPDFQADFVQLHSAVVQSQDILSKIENILSKVIREKSAAERKVYLDKMRFQEKFDRAISNAGKRPTLGEYATGKEKVSEANLAAFTELRILNASEYLLLFATEAVDIIRLHYYGLDKVRQDLRKRLDLQSADLRNA